MHRNRPAILTDAQLAVELGRCEYCEEKPCKAACPADCSPADFIMAVRVGEASDYRRAAALILAKNPFGGVCGAVCPDRHCQHGCVRAELDRAIDIPAVQATIVAKARALGVAPEFTHAPATGRRIAVLGAGPAGYGAAAVLGQAGHAVELFETADRDGGMAALIPEYRLDKSVLAADLAFARALGAITVSHDSAGRTPDQLLAQGFAAVIVAAGLAEPIRLGIDGEEHAIRAIDLLANPQRLEFAGKRVAVIGGGAVAADCAETVKARGAALVEMFALESLAEMPLEAGELAGLLRAHVHVSGRTRVHQVRAILGRIVGLRTAKVTLPANTPFHPNNVVDVLGSEQARDDIDAVVVAIGARPRVDRVPRPGVFFAGDVENGPTTVVEAVAAGKNAALAVLASLGDDRGQGTGDRGQKDNSAKQDGKPRIKSYAVLAGYNPLPVPLDTEFFGTPIRSPLLLSAAPPTDGYEQMKKAYEAGWAGGVMKTAFDGVPIHIPGEYMFAFSPLTYANCDNVSGHALERVCREVERLRREYPDRLTLASTGGPVTGDDALDARGWQSNTSKLEAAGVFGIEYSLSCPQGGDGTKGDIVSQDAELTAKIVDWVMAVSDPEVPKLFKLTAAVTAIYPIIAAIKEVFARYPGKKAGVTLANTFPTLAFRRGGKARWEEGIVVGMSGEGVLPISNLTLANVSRLGVVVSGNGGPMDYKAAAHFLALGARTVQFCTLAMKHGVGVIGDLHSGLSYLLAERGMGSVAELIGRALPDPIIGFMELSATKKISALHEELCVHCGNCSRCPYLAIALDEQKLPRTDSTCCVGCSICVQKCVSGALFMRDRTPEEHARLAEA